MSCRHAEIPADQVTRDVTRMFCKFPNPLQKNNCVGYLMPEAGIEPAQSFAPRDFKSLASTYSATPAQRAI